MIWNLRVQVSTHNIVHGNSALGLARVLRWLNFLNFSMRSRSLSDSWLLFSFREISSLFFLVTRLYYIFYMVDGKVAGT